MTSLKVGDRMIGFKQMTGGVRKEFFFGHLSKGEGNLHLGSKPENLPQVTTDKGEVLLFPEADFFSPNESLCKKIDRQLGNGVETVEQLMVFADILIGADIPKNYLDKMISQWECTSLPVLTGKELTVSQKTTLDAVSTWLYYKKEQLNNKKNV